MSFIKDKLKSKLSKKDLEKVPSSFEVIGDIAILEIRDLKGKDKLIADAILKNLKNIKVVAKKTAIRKGKYRNWKLKIIGGEKRKETLHKESGVLLKLDVEKVFFSSRESTERLRLAVQVKPKEDVLVMFSGICPLPLVIAKKQIGVNKLCAIEFNPIAHKYALENIKLNKLSGKITAYKGDVKKVLPNLGRFDRIAMPLPKDGYKFLNLAFKHIKKNGTIHLYYIAKEERMFENTFSLISNIAKSSNKKIYILRRKKVLPYSSHVWKIVFDIKVLN